MAEEKKTRDELIAERFDEVIKAADDGFVKKMGTSDILVFFEDSSKEPLRVDKLIFLFFLSDDEALYMKWHDAYLNAKNR